jgi:hypothetical protein
MQGGPGLTGTLSLIRRSTVLQLVDQGTAQGGQSVRGKDSVNMALMSKDRPLVYTGLINGGGSILSRLKSRDFLALGSKEHLFFFQANQPCAKKKDAEDQTDNALPGRTCYQLCYAAEHDQNSE